MTPQNFSGCADGVLVRQFEPGDEAAFRALNEEWIRRYFKLETKDEAAFADPRTTILAKGGQILIAVIDGEKVGCCALLRIGEGEFEVAKMAVSPAHQGKGIGRCLLSAAIEEARSTRASRLYLETNHTLTAAIRLYESLGFRHLDASEIKPSPYARTDVYMELGLD